MQCQLCHGYCGNRLICRACVYREHQKDASKRARFLERSAGLKCRHCLTRAVSKPRNLCCACYADQGVRELYPNESPKQFLGETNGPRPLPDPTDALPGSAAKLAILEARCAAEVSLWHPRDNRGDRDEPGSAEEALDALYDALNAD